jgi:hypothetical protein
MILFDRRVQGRLSGHAGHLVAIVADRGVAV